MKTTPRDFEAAGLPSILVMYGSNHSEPAHLTKASDLFEARNFPVEIGLMRSDGEAFCSLVKPELDWKAAPDVENVRDIGPGAALRDGAPVSTIAAALNSHLSGTTVYSEHPDLHRAWLSIVFKAADMQMEFDVESLDSLLSASQKDIWSATTRRVAQMLSFTRKRASADARILQTAVHWTLNNEAFHGERGGGGIAGLRQGAA